MVISVRFHVLTGAGGCCVFAGNRTFPAAAFPALFADVAACIASWLSPPPTIRRFFMYFKKMTRKEDRLSPDMPIRANRTRGRVVRHSTIIRAVRLKGRNRNTGSPVTAARMPASITFLARFSRIRACVSPDDPEWAACACAPAGFVQYDGKLPEPSAPFVAGGVRHQDLPVLHSPQHDKMAAACEVSF